MPDSSAVPAAYGGGIFTRKASIFSKKNKPTTITSASASSTGLLNSDTTSSPSHRRKTSRHSISSVADLGSSFRRSASLRTTSSSSPSSNVRSPSAANLALSLSPEKNGFAASSSKPSLSISTFTRRQKSSEDVKARLEGANAYPKQPHSAVEAPRIPYGMPASLMRTAAPPGRPPGTSQSNMSFAQSSGSLGPTSASTLPPVPNAAQSSHTIIQHIHDTASKRISTLDYLRKAHEGHIYWFNTLRFPLSGTHPSISSLPSHASPSKLARRATNYLLLGFSLPTILDLNSQTPLEYLRALNALLIEFEAYQNIHGDGINAASSLGRGKVAGMFKRATHAAAGAGRGRRASSSATAAMMAGAEPNALGGSHGNSNADAPSDPSSSSSGGAGKGPLSHSNHSTPNLLHPTTTATTSATTTTTTINSAAATSSSASTYASSLPPTDDALLPGEEYSLLLTPSLPFDPDFAQAFASLCDMLIDTYAKLAALVGGGAEGGGAQGQQHAGQGGGGGGGGGLGGMGMGMGMGMGIGAGGAGGVGELFAKADARIRKIIVQAVVREFEEESRRGARSEVAGVGKVVLGGLM